MTGQPEDSFDLAGHAIVSWHKWDDEAKRLVEIETRVVKIPQSGDGWIHYVRRRTRRAED